MQSEVRDVDSSALTGLTDAQRHQAIARWEMLRPLYRRRCTAEPRGAGCPSCSLFAGSVGDNPAHLAARDTAFVAISRAPMTKIEPFQQRMGWTFPWVSSAGSDFNGDMHVSIDEDAGLDEYNYHDVATLKERGQIWIDNGEMPGLSVFLREGQRVFHTYSSYQRGLDHLMNIYNYLDLTPLGRGADDQDPYTMAWVRHHDRYPSTTPPSPAAIG